MPDDEERLPRDVPIDPLVPPELQEKYVRAAFAAQIANTTVSTIHRHWKYYNLLDGIMIGHTLLISREQMRWWKPGRPGPKPKNRTD